MCKRQTILFRILLSACLLLMLPADRAVAQGNKSLKSQDIKRIDRAIIQTLESHFFLLELIATPGLDANDFQEAVEKEFTSGETYLNKSITIEVDYLNNPDKQTADIEDYLNGFYQNFDGKVKREYNWNQKVYQSDNSLIVIVNFSQELRGKSKADKKDLTRQQQKMARLQLQKHGEYEWSARIYQISNATALPANLSEVSLVQDNNDATEEEGYDESYCLARYRQGESALSHRNYGKAYFYLSEASLNRNVKARAERLRDQLQSEISAKNVDYKKHLFDELEKQAAKYKSKNDYELARKYYVLASKLNPMSPSVGAEIEELEKKIKVLQGVDAQYKNQYYAEAIAKYQDALRQPGEERNAYLLLGIAKCYSKLQDNKNAERYFEKALSADENNVSVYKAQGEYYLLNRKYDVAANCFIAIASKIEEQDDPMLAEASSMNALCKGIELFNKGRKSEALDSFKAATYLYDKNTQAWIYQSRCSPKEALRFLDSAIIYNPGCIDGYVEKGNLYRNSKDKKNAISWYKSAINIDKANKSAYLGLGQVYIDVAYLDLSNIAKDTIIKAKGYFEVATKLDTSTAWDAYYGLGKCHYLLNEWKEAENYFGKCQSQYYQRDDFNCDYGFVKLMSGSDPQLAMDLFQKALRKDEAQYGFGLAILKKIDTPNSEVIEYLSKAFERRAVAKSRVDSDFKKLGLDRFLESKEFRKQINYNNL